ncbi:hypothetical protein L596_005680 [Steinernema carpocapsae]|uniref:Uncharacterized protein n=1 Tax=Steinernema carpocapsae TaxID=34508 RepID=A0A4U8V120_STECR|nr:hypothetical protein L596_005680 [Steinernema carpocapsae]
MGRVVAILVLLRFNARPAGDGPAACTCTNPIGNERLGASNGLRRTQLPTDPLRQVDLGDRRSAANPPQTTAGGSWRRKGRFLPAWKRSRRRRRPAWPLAGQLRKNPSLRAGDVNKTLLSFGQLLSLSATRRGKSIRVLNALLPYTPILLLVFSSACNCAKSGLRLAGKRLRASQLSSKERSKTAQRARATSPASFAGAERGAERTRLSRLSVWLAALRSRRRSSCVVLPSLFFFSPFPACSVRPPTLRNTPHMGLAMYDGAQPHTLNTVANAAAFAAVPHKDRKK